MKRSNKYIVRPSRFLVITVTAIMLTLVIIIIYISVASVGKVNDIQNAITEQLIYDELDNILTFESFYDSAQESGGAKPAETDKITEMKSMCEWLKENKINGINCVDVVFVVVFILAILYVVLSFWIMLTHRTEADPRLQLLPIIFSPVFLILENALLHVLHIGTINANMFVSEKFDMNGAISSYYAVVIGIFNALSVAVITFSSLKFSFDISSRRKRFNETAEVKPDIVLQKPQGMIIPITISRHPCYLCGLYVGKIERVKYIDYKRFGNKFEMSKLYYPDKKMYLDINSEDIKLSEFLSSYGKISKVKQIVNICKYQEIYLIFRDAQNYYYFAQLPINKKDSYNVIGVSEIAMSRLLILHNKYELRRENKDRRKKKCGDFSPTYRKTVRYSAMDMFVVPRNYFPKNP